MPAVRPARPLLPLVSCPFPQPRPVRSSSPFWPATAHLRPRGGFRSRRQHRVCCLGLSIIRQPPPHTPSLSPAAPAPRLFDPWRCMAPLFSVTSSRSAAPTAASLALCGPRLRRLSLPALPAALPLAPPLAFPAPSSLVPARRSAPPTAASLASRPRSLQPRPLVPAARLPLARPLASPALALPGHG